VLAGFIGGTVTVVAWHNIPVLNGLLYEMIPGFLVSLFATVLFSLWKPGPFDLEPEIKAKDAAES